jgi:hypothetical protein
MQRGKLRIRIEKYRVIVTEVYHNGKRIGKYLCEYYV